MSLLTGNVVDGAFIKSEASKETTGTGATNTTSKGKASKGTEYNQEMFLQLLVAEMQYQDPLEPTSNTEYVSELASFTQIEAVQSVQNEMKTLEANSLVGQIVNIIDDDGEAITGKVDYVANKDGELFLSIEDKLYSLDKLDTVVDEKYYNGVMAADAFSAYVAKLPTLSGLSLSDEAAVNETRALFDAMDDYTKGFVKVSDYETLTNLEGRIKELKKIAGSDSSSEADKETEATDEVSE